MLKLKRSYDTFASSHMDMDMMDSDSVQTSTFSSCSSSQPIIDSQQHFFRPVKRIRPILQPTPAQTESETENFDQTDLSKNVSQKPVENKNRVNYFPTPEDLGLPTTSELVDQYKSERKQLKKLQPRASSSSSSKSTKEAKKTFTEDEVRLILKHREFCLREEYNRILNEKLAEQFNQFAQFNLDYISKQFTNREFSYTS